MASVKVPELELELASGTLGGMVTTVEGLITKISESKFYFLTLGAHPCFDLWKICGCYCYFSPHLYY